MGLRLFIVFLVNYFFLLYSAGFSAKASATMVITSSSVLAAGSPPPAAGSAATFDLLALRQLAQRLGAAQPTCLKWI